MVQMQGSLLRNSFMSMMVSPQSEETVDLLTQTREMLAEPTLRLHKVASNRQQGMEAFPVEDLAKDLKDLELGVDPLPLQRSPGLF